MRICFPTMTYTKVAIKKEICFSSMFPCANRVQRPIYRTRNPFGGHTFKRNHEGDYKCTDAEVRRMIADSDESHPRDSRILPNYSMEDIDKETLIQYRQLLPI